MHGGSSYFEAPEYIKNKHCLVNIRNYDQRCFLWSVLASLYPQKQDAGEVSKYQPLERTLNVQDLKFPLQPKQAAVFEKNNPTISVNIYSLGEEKGEICVEYLSRQKGRKSHVNLLLLSHEVTGQRHYTCIRSMSRLIAGRTNHHERSHVCCSCLHVFSRADLLQQHEPLCVQHPPQMVRYPDPEDPDDCTVKFRGRKKQHRVPFYLVCDFECFLQPADDDDDDDDDNATATNVVDRHKVCGFACYRVTEYEQHRTDPTVYSGDDVMTKFFEHVMSENREISKILDENVPMLPMTDEERALYDAAKHCHNCGAEFTRTNQQKKCRHHDHISGRFLFPACNSCNLQLKMTATTRRRQDDNDDYDHDDDGDASKKAGSKRKRGETRRKSNKRRRPDNDDHSEFVLNCLFHNLKNYDGHMIIKNFEKKYLQYEHESGKISYRDVDVIAINSEKYMTFKIDNIRFIDSFQFLSTSLDNLVSLLLKDSKERFRHTTKYLGSDEIVFSKGVYPYSHMTDRRRFDETELPPIDCFYDTLNDEPLDPKDYERAQRTWKHFGITNLRAYHDHYLLSDVLLLADVFENFRNSVYAQHRIDCLHFFTLPSLSWAAALKFTGAKLDLLTDPAAYLMVENAMRGGIATISNRYASANNPLLDGYDDQQPTSYITYLDANNLYGAAMTEPLPVGKFRFLADDQLRAFQLDQVAADSDTGYIVQCDIEYPEALHSKHSDYPLAPEHMTVTKDMLSPFSLSFVDAHWRPQTKLVPNLCNKSNYVCHYRNLQFYVEQGLKVTRIHRILAFEQSPFLKPWIDYCTAQRMRATSEFQSDLAKLMANATFGKTMEQVRNRQNIRIIADTDKLTKAVSKVSFRQSEIINDDLVLVKAARQRVTLNKPISVGFAVLELSKLIMYKFYYGHLKAKYGDRCRLLFTDTDSLCCHIETSDLYGDMANDMDLYDTSNFDETHPQFSAANRKVLGKFKSETGSVPPKEFVGLRAKMYSLIVPEKPKHDKIRVKGIKRAYVKKNVRHQQFLQTLRTLATTNSKFRAFRSRRHTVETIEVSKTCLNAFDDKRYILGDGMCTLAYGHRDIAAAAAVATDADSEQRAE